MKRQFRFNKRGIDGLPPCPADARSKEIEHGDTDVGGLRLQVNRIGRKSFLFRYQINGRKRAMKIGGYPETTIEEARNKAIEWKAMIAKGLDPQETRDEAKKSGMTYQTFYDDYLWPHILSTKRSAKADASRYRGHILPALADKELGKITTLELQRFHNENKSKVAVATSNRIFELVRHSFTLAEQWALIPPGSNPARGIKLWKENNKRERYLSQDELVRFMKALEAERSQDCSRLFPATAGNGLSGGRSREIAVVPHQYGTPAMAPADREIRQGTGDHLERGGDGDFAAPAAYRGEPICVSRQDTGSVHRQHDPGVA